MLEATYDKGVFAKNLKHYMALADENSVDIARLLGVTKGAVSTWCNGLKIPRVDKIEKLALHFGITKSMLLEEHNDSAKEKIANALNLLSDQSLDKVIDYIELLLLQQTRQGEQGSRE